VASRTGARRGAGGGGAEGGLPTERPRKLYKIGELIERSGISRQTLHNYTMLGLIEPASRTPSGHRLYAEEAFELLERIKALRKTHTLMEIKELLGRRRGGER
jgi:DNA-binding transcriptional MerR regulator